MKSSAIFFVIAVLGLTPMGFAASSREAKIDDYKSGEYAVNRRIEEDLRRKVVAPLTLELKRQPGAKIHINVTGFADQEGRSIDNTRLARDRAEQVADFLLQIFPDAQVVPLSKGDEANVKMVDVVFWIETPGAAAPAQNLNGHRMFLDPKPLMLGLGLGLVMFVYLVFRFRNWRKPIAPATESEPPQKPAEERWISTHDKNGDEVRILLTVESVEDGKELWATPFHAQSNPDFTIRFPKFADAEMSAKRCFKNPKYAEQIPTLLAKRKIVVYKGE